MKKVGWKIALGIFVVCGLMGLADALGCVACTDMLVQVRDSLLMPTPVSTTTP